jgi:hypothetical protein
MVLAISDVLCDQMRRKTSSRLMGRLRTIIACSDAGSAELLLPLLPSVELAAARGSERKAPGSHLRTGGLLELAIGRGVGCEARLSATGKGQGHELRLDAMRRAMSAAVPGANRSASATCKRLIAMERAHRAIRSCQKGREMSEAKRPVRVVV